MSDPGQIALGGTLLLTPPVVLLLQDISLMASCVAAVCGAVIGVVAVVRLVKRGRAPK